MTTFLGRYRVAAQYVLAALVFLASAVSFAESYRGLYLWSDHHGLHGAWAYVWPVQVDVFIAVGEIALFLALAYNWPPRSRRLPWIITACGLAVSVAGNIGHVPGHELSYRLTAAVPPVTAMAGLAAGLAILKLIVQETASREARPPVPSPAAGNELPVLPGAGLAGVGGELAGLKSDAARIRLASASLDTSNARQVTDWLAGHGYIVQIDNVRSTLQRARKPKHSLAAVTALPEMTAGSGTDDRAS